jgi:hypothetical protein
LRDDERGNRQEGRFANPPSCGACTTLRAWSMITPANGSH